MKYNFDKIIPRQHTHAVSVDGYRPYLLGAREEEALEFPCPESELIQMWVADMAFSTAPEIINALKKRVEHGVFGYTKVFDAKYYESFANWAKSRYDWSIDVDHLVTSHGVVPALFDLVELLCRPGEKVLTLTPSYAYFKRAAEYHNIELVTSRLICRNGNYFMDYEDIKTKVKNEKIALFILCSPHNPTGRIWTSEELKTIGEICLEQNVTIISDEIHCDILRKGNSFTPLAKLFPNSDSIITCMAPSKTFNLAGFMLANIIIPNAALRATWKKRHYEPDNPLSVVAMEAAYSSGQAWLNALTEYLDNNFDLLDRFLKKRLPKAKFVIPQATYLAWIDVSAYFEEHENLTRFFAQHAGVLLEGGNRFVENGNGYIRVNIACPKSKLKEGLHRMAKAIRNK